MATTVRGTRERTTPTKGAKRERQRSQPSDDEIRILAYHLYERRRADGLDGDSTADWIEAERHLCDKATPD